MQENNRKKQLPLLVILSLLILPLTLGAVYLVIREFNHQTNLALERRGTIANLGAMLIHEKFDGIIDVGTSLASRRLVYQNMEKGKWDEAIESMEGIPQAFPYIEMIGLFDTSGVLKAIIPQTPELIGKSFAKRDYYQGVSKEWKPYVSEAFKRVAEPKYNVVSIAVPIKSPEQKILGILLLTIKLDAIVGWGKEMDAGQGGLVLIVDKRGQLITHNYLKPEDDLMDYSSVESVQRLLHGESGVEIHEKDFASDEEHVAAYSHVKDYGFGIEVLQPTRTAFAERKSQLIEFILFWTIIIFSTSVFLYRILKDRIMLRAQRDRETILLESIGDGIVAVDRNWNIILWNKSASAITGWSKEEVLGKSLRAVLKILRERNRKEDISCIEDAVIRGKATSMSDDMLLVKKDGSEVPVGDSAAPIFGPNGEVEGAIVVFRDMSKERESTHLRSDFMYASHQLRTPVTEALWNLEIAIDEQDPDKRKEGLQIVQQSLFSVKKLSEHLVSVSEIDRGNVAVNLSAIKLIDVLTEVQSELETETKMRDVALSITPVSPLMAINTDKKLFGKALFEIIENAVNYSHRGARVDVTTTLQEKNLLVKIVDAGVGITEEEQAIIFTKFFRGSNRGPKNAGDGLGLYLAKEYITLLGGKIWFESVEGKGTTFFVSLPIA